jgi:hypothetical protein
MEGAMVAFCELNDGGLIGDCEDGDVDSESNCSGDLEISGEDGCGDESSMVTKSEKSSVLGCVLRGCARGCASFDCHATPTPARDVEMGIGAQ